jgi:hypothetical protein
MGIEMLPGPVRIAHLHPDRTSNASVLQSGWLSWDLEEDEMSSTLHTTCPLCGLRFSGRPLLDLHLREDHPQRNRPAEPAHHSSRDTPTPRGGEGGPSRSDDLASGQAHPGREEVKERPRPGRAMTALRRAIGILRSPASAGREAQPASPVSRADRSA